MDEFKRLGPLICENNTCFDSLIFSKTKIKEQIDKFTSTKNGVKDCGSKQYLKMHVTETNNKKLIGKYVKTSIGIKVITSESIKWYIGKTVLIRSVLYCKADNEYCDVCLGAKS